MVCGGVVVGGGVVRPTRTKVSMEEEPVIRPMGSWGVRGVGGEGSRVMGSRGWAGGFRKFWN